MCGTPGGPKESLLEEQKIIKEQGKALYLPRIGWGGTKSSFPPVSKLFLICWSDWRFRLSVPEVDRTIRNGMVQSARSFFPVSMLMEAAISCSVTSWVVVMVLNRLCNRTCSRVCCKTFLCVWWFFLFLNSLKEKEN